MILNYFFSQKNSVKYLHKVPKFYEQLLSIWYDIHNTEPSNKNEVMDEIIWGNKNILIGNKPLENNLWKSKNICLMMQDCF